MKSRKLTHIPIFNLSLFAFFICASAVHSSSTLAFESERALFQSVANPVDSDFRNFVTRKYGSFKSRRENALSALKQRHVSSNGLTDEELVAIWTYTYDGFSGVNSAMRSGGAALDQYRSYIDELSSALEKLPDYIGKVTRGTDMPTDILDLHQVGNVVEYKAFTSTSKTLSFGGHVQITIISRHGKFIDNYSKCFGQNEVLIGPSKFRVLDRHDLPSGQISITLEQIES